ncbi:uncharacterized protein GLRG_01874 [Colletotrichum graminicola M1.001]|uniref:Uncharacterized protein n=1 Tax=Colletotrichum graminicola (strain M1.001 / M2 / FGSC 10212) TaxID=645133 RepID=E3Q9K0_COLGM|nr:uncharacterized protein GLRG_01874 [Colletotrichum graminicola M1.001]EFQ27379.1 hypothetical protein GLRG_01874 [Colletotrichum graminicola M1.001]
MPPKAALPVPGLTATEAEIKLAFAVLKFMRRPNTTPVYDAIAVEAGSASGDSVRHGVRKAADKHGWFSQAPAEDPASAPAATPRPKKAATPRKKKIAEVDDEDEATAAGQGEDEGTPKKKRARKAKGKAAAAATEKDASEGEEDDKNGAASAPTPVSEEE